MKRQPDQYVGPTTLGIDVSRWQGDVKWNLVATDLRIKFAISRIGDGRSVDIKFKENWIESKNSGLIRGSYHYFRADRDGKFQANLAIDTIDKAGGLLPTDLPPAIDIEGGANKNLPGGVLAGDKDLPIGLVVEECLEYLQILEEKLGVRPLVYTGQAFHWWIAQQHPDLAVEFAKYPLWVPSYTPVAQIPADLKGTLFPWSFWSIWQYSSSGKVSGVDGPVDMNKFRGTEQDLKKFIAGLRPGAETEKIDPRDHILAEMKCLIERLAELQEKLQG